MHDVLTIEEVIDQIAATHRQVEYSWKNVHGYAPDAAAKLLGESRLDWLVSLAYTLRLWVDEEVAEEQHDGQLIFGLGQSRQPRGRDNEVLSFDLLPNLRLERDRKKSRQHLEATLG